MALSCPHACPPVATLYADCAGSSTSTSIADSALWVASAAANTSGISSSSGSSAGVCTDVEVVNASELQGIGIAAANLTALSLTSLNLTGNSVKAAEDVEIPETLKSLYLDENLLGSLLIPEHWGALELLSVSNNPIASFSAESKLGPMALVARNVSLTSMTNASLPDTLRQLDVSATVLSTWRDFEPPEDLFELIARDAEIQMLGPANFSLCERSFTMDFSGNNISTIQGIQFPPNLHTLLLNGSSVTLFEVRKSDIAVLEQLETFAVKSMRLSDAGCEKPSTQTSVTIGGASYPVCVLPDANFAEEYNENMAAKSSTDFVTVLLLLLGIAAAIFVLLLIFIVQRKVIDEHRAKAVLAQKQEAEARALGLDGYDDEEEDEFPTTSGPLSDDVRNDPDFERHRISQKDLERVKQITKGANGVVYFGLIKSSREKVVLKQLAPEKAKSMRDLQRFTREIRLYASLKHPKIVSFRGVAWSSLANLALILEYMPNGDLAGFLETQRKLDGERRGWGWIANENSAFSGHSKLTVALDVADALVYLHSFADPVMHRDLKAQNVLLSNKWVAKLSDFGVSKARQRRQGGSGGSTGGPMTAEVGTVAWIAPEVIRGARYDQQADIYSFGVVLCELDTCAKPYALGAADAQSVSGMTSFVTASVASTQGDNDMLSTNASLALAVSENRVTPAFHPDCPRAVLELAKLCLSYDPKGRPTAKELCRSLQALDEPGASLRSARRATVDHS